MSIMGWWVAVVFLGVMILFVVGLVGALRISLELTLDERGERRSRATLNRVPMKVLAVALLLLTASPFALADPAAAEPCPVSTPAQAREVADTLFEQGAYQRAGDCYQAAGEYSLADKAFLKAVRPESAVIARQLADHRDQAKALLHQVQRAFGANH